MFYAAVELRDNPSLIGKPVAVGGMGMISTSNYEARKFGVRSAMPGFIGVKLCPQLVFVKPDFKKYTKVALRVREIFSEYDPNFEAYSLDEAYLNITEYVSKRVSMSEPLSCKEGMDAIAQIVSGMRARVKEATRGLTCSAGVACTRMAAKIGSDMNKPDGQYLLCAKKCDVVAFVRGLKLRKVPGIGKVSEKVLQGIGISTVEGLWDKRAELHLVFKSKTAMFFLRVSLGITSCIRGSDDDNENDPSASGRKSFSMERTFSDLSSPKDLLKKLSEICQSLSETAKKKRLVGKTLTLKLKTNKFDIKNRSVSLAVGVGFYGRELFRIAEPLLKSEFPITIRLMGIRLSNLTKVLEVSRLPDRHRQSGLNEYMPSCEEAAQRIKCPVCNVALAVKKTEDPNAALNLHIDQCLNRRWIRENVSTHGDKTSGTCNAITVKRRKLNDNNNSNSGILKYFKK